MIHALRLKLILLSLHSKLFSFTNLTEALSASCVGENLCGEVFLLLINIPTSTHRMIVCTTATAVTPPKAAAKGVHPCDSESGIVLLTAGLKVLKVSSWLDAIITGEEGRSYVDDDVVTLEHEVLTNCGTHDEIVQGSSGDVISNDDDEEAMLEEVAAPGPGK